MSHQAGTRDKPGNYWLTIVLTDDDGHDYVFHSKEQYKHDETGKANFDMSTVQTANFNFK